MREINVINELGVIMLQSKADYPLEGIIIIALMIDGDCWTIGFKVIFINKIDPSNIINPNELINLMYMRINMLKQ